MTIFRVQQKNNYSKEHYPVMQKAYLRKLVNEYNGVGGDTPHTKGFFKKAFKKSTQGMMSLQSLLEGELQHLEEEQQISGSAFLRLLNILDANKERLTQNSRNTATNRIFKIIYEQLLIEEASIRAQQDESADPFEYSRLQATIEAIKQAINTSQNDRQLNGLFIVEGMTDLFIRPKQLVSVFDNFLSNPRAWLLMTNTGFKYINHFSYRMYECACARGGAFDRLSNSRREIIENQILAFAQELPVEENKTIKYASIGSGRLLQDFILCARLLRAGFNLDISLIDTLYRDVESIKQEEYYQQFCYLYAYAEALGLRIEIKLFESTDQYKEAGLTADIMAAIDFEDYLKEGEAFTAIMTAQNCLSSEGQLFLAFGDTDLVFTKTACSSAHFQPHPIVETIPNIEPSSIKIADLLPSNFGDYLARLIHIILPYVIREETVNHCEISMIQPYYKDNHSKKDSSISTAFLENFIRLLIPSERNISVKIKFVSSEDEIDRSVNMALFFGKQYTLTPWLPTTFHHSGARDDHLIDIEQISEKYHSATILFGIKANRPVSRDQFGRISCTPVFDKEWVLNNAAHSLHASNTQPKMQA